MTKNVVVIEGEDAAPEAVRPVVALIDSLALDIEWQYPVVGEPAIAKGEAPFPDDARKVIDASDATLFGATSGASWDALFYLRWGRGTYANVRPTKWLPGYTRPLAHPEEIDFIIVRENLEDAYVGVEGPVEDLKSLDLIEAEENDSPLLGRAELTASVRAKLEALERGNEPETAPLGGGGK